MTVKSSRIGGARGRGRERKASKPSANGPAYLNATAAVGTPCRCELADKHITTRREIGNRIPGAQGGHEATGWLSVSVYLLWSDVSGGNGVWSERRPSRKVGKDLSAESGTI